MDITASDCKCVRVCHIRIKLALQEERENRQELSCNVLIFYLQGQFHMRKSINHAIPHPQTKRLAEERKSFPSISDKDKKFSPTLLVSKEQKWKKIKEANAMFSPSCFPYREEMLKRGGKPYSNIYNFRGKMKNKNLL